jgi:hypothetical protein
MNWWEGEEDDSVAPRSWGAAGELLGELVV